MQGLLDTQKPLDGQKFSIATMDTRKNIAEKTRSKIEEAFLSDDPYRDIEVFRNLFEVDDILSLQNKFVRNIKPNKFRNLMAIHRLAIVDASKIGYSDFKDKKTITEKIAYACQHKSSLGKKDQIPKDLQKYFEKILDLFCEIMLDQEVQISSGYATVLLMNALGV
jgi:hypothetical protein